MVTDSTNTEPLKLTLPLALQLIVKIVRLLAFIVLALAAYRTLVFMLTHFQTGVAIEKQGLKVLANTVLSWKP